MKTRSELIRLMKSFEDPEEAIAAAKAEGVTSEDVLYDILTHTKERPMDDIPDEIYDMITGTWDDKNGEAQFVHGTCQDPDEEHDDMYGMDCGGRIVFKDGAWRCSICGEKSYVGKFGEGLESFVIADYWVM